MAVIPKAGQVFHGEDGTFSIVLPDTCDPNNEPTQEELLDYANWLGIDAEKEPHLLWIARQGLRTPLPAEWKACRTGEGDVYYFNFLTGENSWEHPMDDVFKRKVEEERAKLVDGEGGSSKTRKKSKSSSTAGGKGDGGVEKRRLEKGAAGYVTSSERSGKGGKLSAVMSPTSSTSTSPMTKGLPATALRFGRLGALGTPEATQRLTPDVSGLLKSSNSGDRSFTRFGFGGNNTSTSSLGLAAGGISGGIGSGKLSLTKPPDGVKEMETQIRRRIDEEMDTRLRAMRTRHEKRIMEERTAMEKELQKVKEDGECAVAAAQQRHAEGVKQRAQAELESLRRALEKEHTEVKGRVESLRQTLQRERVSMESTLQERLEEVRKKLQLSHSEGLIRQREASAARLTKEKARLLEDLARRLDAEANDLEKKTQTTVGNLKKTLEAERAKLKEELNEKWMEHGDRSASSAVAEAEAQRAYEAAVQKATSDAASAMEALRREYRLKEEKLRAAKEEENCQEKDSSTAMTSFGDANKNDGLKRREAEAEAERLERALKQKIAQYEAETQRLVATRQATMMKNIGPLRDNAESGDQGGSNKTSSKNNKVGHFATAALQEQRRFEVASRRLETKHAQSMDRIRREHEMILREKNLFNPRQSSGYLEKIKEEHKSWLKAHPPIALTMPQLGPVPAAPGLMEVPPVPMPGQEEQQKSVDIAVTGAKQKRAVEDRKKLAEMEAALSREMKEAVASYHEKRLREIEAQLTQYRVAQAEEYQRRSYQMAADIAEAVSPQSSQLRGKAEDPVPRLNEVSLEEAKMREEEIRRHLQGRIDALEELKWHARDELRQRQEEAQRKTLALTPATTALQRPPPVPTDTFFPGCQEQKISPRPCQQQQQPHGLLTPVLNRTLSTIAPANSLWSSTRPSPTKPYHWLSADNAASSLSWQENHAPSVGAGNVEKVLPSSLSQRDVVLEDRLHRASLLLKKKKEELRAQQAHMERARDAWRRDMEECRRKRDRKHALMLRELKEVLEEKAVQLNHEVMELKRATQWLRKRTAHYKQTLNIQTSNLASAEETSTADHIAANGSGRIISLLKDILANTELLGSYVASTKKTDARKLRHRRCRSPASPPNSHTYPHPSRHGDALSSWKNAGPSGVTRWLMEQ
ncbi:putative Centrosomal protein of 164 kDa [Trypanosoma cruzi]|nr:putative Centrosomal protein of 164 kDa [Trypanosoma cruzi]